jgi:hypothetical protein
MGYKTSEQGLKLIESARKRKGWGRQDIQWQRSANVSVATLKRFLSGEEVSEDTFKSLCAALGIQDWRAIAENCNVPQQDWGNAPLPGAKFYGRAQELETLEHWIVSQQCRLIAVRGLTGIGKTSLIRHLSERLKDQFEFVIWYSLYPSPLTLQELLDYLAARLFSAVEVQSYGIDDLIYFFQNHRCLVILDDIQAILEPKQLSGRYQNQFRDYQTLFEKISQPHQSCLITIGNEQPTTLAMLAERNDWVRSFSLKGLEKIDALQLLKEQNLINLENGNSLIASYSGNPFFIKFIAKKISALSGGSISKYLDLKTTLVGGISEWLEDQLNRISLKEEKLLYWLVILRYPISFHELLDQIQWQGSSEEIFNSLESLLNRSLVDKTESDDEVVYSLNPVLLKYNSIRLVHEVLSEISSLLETQELSEVSILQTHPLFRLSEKLDIQQAQKRYLLGPIRQNLVDRYLSSDAALKLFDPLLSSAQLHRFMHQGYVSENLDGLRDLLRSPIY